MSGFTVPFSSSPPSTPGSRPGYKNGSGPSFSNFGPNPSTTPAGPPPSSARSFTPAGPPPASVFGSSELGSGNTLFQSKSRFSPKPGSQQKANGPAFKTFHPHKSSPSRFKSSPLGRTHERRTNTFKAPSSSLRSSLVSNDDFESEDDLDEEEEDEEEEDLEEERSEGDMDVDSNAENHPPASGPTIDLQKEQPKSPRTYDWTEHGSSITGRSLRSDKSSRAFATLPPDLARQSDPPLKKRKDSTVPLLSRNFAKQIGSAVLVEPDELILETEDLTSQLYLGEAPNQDQEQDHNLLEAALGTVPEALSKLWQSCCNKEKQQSPREHEFFTGIGPGEDESTVQKANFLSTLLLQLHHPPAAKGKQALAESRPNQYSFRSRIVHSPESQPKAKSYPNILLDWLEVHHNPYQTVISDIQSHYPDSTAHVSFWDIIFSLTLRGKLIEVIRMFKDADFKHAWTAREDGQSENGYRDGLLSSTTRVINRAIQLLESCPAQRDGDWNVIGGDWMIFRKRVEQVMSDLASFAEGRDRDLDPAESTFEAENFGIKTTSKALSRSIRRAESKVPWTIYQNLKTLCGILLGGTTEIISVSQNWVEAAVGLTAWWDGSDDDEVAVGSLAMTRRSLNRSHSQIPRSVDANVGGAYLRRLAYAYEKVTDDSQEDAFLIDPLNPVEVGLASIFEGDVEGVLGLLRAWSMPIASAVVEISTLAGWFESTGSAGVVDGFDESDLMVLSYGRPERGLSRDGILIDYAHMLFSRQTLEDVKSETLREGWELSMQILTRLDDTTMANSQVGDLLRRLSLHSDHRADKMVGICRAFGLDKEAAEISERYADFIVENSDRYGTAIIYYARAHSSKKVTDVLNLLVSLSLVHSLAYPPSQNLDPHLRDLVSTPRESLFTLAKLDTSSTNLLQPLLSGYATIRKFYNLRDEDINLAPGHRPSLPPISRKGVAAAALVALIASAADNIHGGLYDENRGAILQVDGLLALLGEALVFVDQPTRILTLPQIFTLLKAIEDLQSVSPTIYAQCESCFQATLATATRSGPSPSSQLLLKKSVSELTASSAFSLVGSSILDAEDGVNGKENGKETGKAVQGKGRNGEKRGWDWRTGMAKGAKGQDVLRMLRLGLAREVARAWMEGEEDGR